MKTFGNTKGRENRQNMQIMKVKYNKILAWALWPATRFRPVINSLFLIPSLSDLVSVILSAFAGLCGIYVVRC